MHMHCKEKSPSQSYSTNLTWFIGRTNWLCGLQTVQMGMTQCTCLYWTFLDYTHRNSNLVSLKKGSDTCNLTSITNNFLIYIDFFGWHLLKYNSHTIQFPHLNCTIKCFLLHSQSYTLISINIIQSISITTERNTLHVGRRPHFPILFSPRQIPSLIFYLYTFAYCGHFM